MINRPQFCDWTIDDDHNNREFDVRVFFQREVFDAGDEITPPYGGTPVMLDIEVFAARELDMRGNVLREIPAADTEQYLQFLHAAVCEDPALIEKLTAVLSDD